MGDLLNEKGVLCEEAQRGAGQGVRSSPPLAEEISG